LIASSLIARVVRASAPRVHRDVGWIRGRVRASAPRVHGDVGWIRGRVRPKTKHLYVLLPRCYVLFSI